MTSHKLLLDEPLLTYQPALVRRIGLAEAAIVQQLQFWTRHATMVHDGHVWVYKTYADWSAEIGLSPKAVRGALDRLRKNGLVIAVQSPLDPRDRTLWWRIEYSALDDDEPGSPSAPEGSPGAPKGSSRARGPSGLSDPTGITEDCTEITTEKTARDARVDLAPIRPRPKPRASFKGKPVPDHLTDRAVSVLAAYNASFGQSLRPFSGTGKPSGHLTQVLGKVVEHEDMELADFERVLCAVKANPPSFCDGRAVGLGDIFGPKAWTRALENGGRPAQNGHVLQPRTVAEAKWLEKREREQRRSEGLERALAVRRANEQGDTIDGEATEL